MGIAHECTCARTQHHRGWARCNFPTACWSGRRVELEPRVDNNLLEHMWRRARAKAPASCGSCIPSHTSHFAACSSYIRIVILSFMLADVNDFRLPSYIAGELQVSCCR